MRIKIWGELRLMCITAFNANYCKCKLVKYRFCYTKLFNRNAASGYTAVSSHAVINDLRASKDARRRETLFVIAASAKTTQLVWVVCCAWCAMHLSFIKLLFYLPSGTWNFLPLLPPPQQLRPSAAFRRGFIPRFALPLRVFLRPPVSLSASSTLASSRSPRVQRSSIMYYLNKSSFSLATICSVRGLKIGLCKCV